MDEIDWTRVYEDAVGIPEPCQPIGCDNGYHLLGCEVAKLATESCPPWQEAVLETLPNLVELIQQQAAEMRRAWRMNVDAAIVVDLPRWMESKLTPVDLELIRSGYAHVNWID